MVLLFSLTSAAPSDYRAQKSAKIKTTILQQNAFDEFFKYFIHKARYPQNARANNIEGLVVVKFKITDNKMDDLIVAKGVVSTDVDIEVVRTIKGYQQAINAKPGPYKLPIYFVLKDQDTDVAGKVKQLYNDYLKHTTDVDSSSTLLNGIIIIGS